MRGSHDCDSLQSIGEAIKQTDIDPIVTKTKLNAIYCGDPAKLVVEEEDIR